MKRRIATTIGRVGTKLALSLSLSLFTIALFALAAPDAGAQIVFEPPDINPITGRFANIVQFNSKGVRETMVFADGLDTNAQTFIADDGIHATASFVHNGENVGDTDQTFTLTRDGNTLKFGIDYPPFDPGQGPCTGKLFPQKWTINYNGESARTPALTNDENGKALLQKLDAVAAVARIARDGILGETGDRMEDFLLSFFEANSSQLTPGQIEQIQSALQNVLMVFQADTIVTNIPESKILTCSITDAGCRKRDCVEAGGEFCFLIPCGCCGY